LASAAAMSRDRRKNFGVPDLPGQVATLITDELAAPRRPTTHLKIEIFVELEIRVLLASMPHIQNVDFATTQLVVEDIVVHDKTSQTRNRQLPFRSDPIMGKSDNNRFASRMRCASRLCAVLLCFRK
jgi:hypothetical protein